MAATKDTLGRLLSTFTRSAWRLEALDRYEEDDAYRAFLRGEPQTPPDPGFDAYLDGVRAMSSQGRTIGRVHAIVGPLTPYLRYEIEWGYVISEPAGDGIRILHRPTWDQTPFRRQPPDFWIFDDSVVALMQYAPDGRWLGLDVVDAATELGVYRTMRDLAIEHSVPLRDYLAVMRRAPVDPSAELVDQQRIAS